MKQKEIIFAAIFFLLIYTGSYCIVRLSKLLVHQKVALVITTPFIHNGRGVCYIIHHEIGRGSYTDQNHYNAIKTSCITTRTGRLFYYPLVKLELSYWKIVNPRYIYETVCSE